MKRGQLFIYGDADRRETALVAVISKVYDKQIRFFYVSEVIARRGYGNVRTANWNEVHLLDDFGVRAEFDGEKFRCVKTRNSVVKYADGEPRDWQEQNPQWHKIQINAAKFIAAE